MREAGDRTFWALLAVFASVFLVCYPVTYAIEDESGILSLTTAFGAGTVFLDEAGIDLGVDLAWHGHVISKFSAFHAALLVPALLTWWRLAFLVTAGFFVAGAFVFRDMLRRQELSAAWTALYFLNPGLLFYSRTLLSMVPASVMALLGASLLFRVRPRPLLAGAAFGAAVLLHAWLAPVAAAIATGWWIERARWRIRDGLWVCAGALPGALALMVYNWTTVGNPFQNAYTIMGLWGAFEGTHVGEFFPFYMASLMVTPLAGWAAVRRRWSRSWTMSGTVVLIVGLASVYYYRDGIGYGIAGWIPGQRFLLPASLLAGLPAARCLSSRLAPWGRRRQAALAVCSIALFAIGFVGLSIEHQRFLRAHLAIQEAILANVPQASLVVCNENVFKEFAPVHGRWIVRPLTGDDAPSVDDRRRAYAVWVGAPGQQPPRGWQIDRVLTVVEARSRIWSRDVWIAGPTRRSSEIARRRGVPDFHDGLLGEHQS